MALDKSVLQVLRKYAAAFRDARDRSANESDTVMYLVKLLEEGFGYDSLKGEISREFAVKDRFCDLAIKLEGEVKLLIEGKAASIKGLVDKHIEQAENYASRSGIVWVLLTNGIEWKLYHLSFVEGEGINHDIAWEANLLEEIETNAESLWAKLSLLNRPSMAKNLLEGFWSQKKALSPASVVRVLFCEDVLMAVRRELNRTAPARLELQDVFNAIRDSLSREAILAAGEIGMTKKKKRKKRVVKTDAATGNTVVEEIEEDIPENDPECSQPPALGVFPPEANAG